MKEKNKVKYVLFEPNLVGWAEGLDGAIRDAKKFNVPLAVKTQFIASQIGLLKSDVKVIVLEDK